MVLLEGCHLAKNNCEYAFFKDKNKSYCPVITEEGCGVPEDPLPDNNCPACDGQTCPHSVCGNDGYCEDGPCKGNLCV